MRFPGAGAVVTGCPATKTECHDNFGYCVRKRLIRYGVFHQCRGTRFALHLVVTYAQGVAVIDTAGAVKG